MLSLLFINFVTKLVFTTKSSLNTGQIIPHIIAIKTVSTAIYPGYYEMISFSKGFMLFDFPWANNFFGTLLGSSFDYIPSGYKIFYTNLNIGSMYFIGVLLSVVLVIVNKTFM